MPARSENVTLSPRSDTFILSYPSKRYRSALIGIAVHSAQSILVLGLVLALVLKG